MSALSEFLAGPSDTRVSCATCMSLPELSSLPHGLEIVVSTRNLTEKCKTSFRLHDRCYESVAALRLNPQKIPRLKGLIDGEGVTVCCESRGCNEKRKVHGAIHPCRCLHMQINHTCTCVPSVPLIWILY